jgi:hypothetical protein
MNLDSVRVQFQSQNPHNTLFLRVWADANNEPTEMYAALNKLGFTQDEVPPAPPIPAEHCYAAGYAKGDKTLIVEQTFVKGGSGLFGSWTPEEKKVNVPAVRGALRKFGFVRIDHRKLRLEDML